MAALTAAVATRLRRPENVSILTALVVAIPATVLVQSWLDWAGLGFLLLIAVGVTVPTMYRQQWPRHRSIGGAVGWTVAASVVVAAVLLGVALLLGTYGGVGELAAGVVGFLLVGLGGPLALYRLSGEMRA